MFSSRNPLKYSDESAVDWFWKSLLTPKWQFSPAFFHTSTPEIPTLLGSASLYIESIIGSAPSPGAWSDWTQVILTEV